MVLYKPEAVNHRQSLSLYIHLSKKDHVADIETDLCNIKVTFLEITKKLPVLRWKSFLEVLVFEVEVYFYLLKIDMGCVCHLHPGVTIFRRSEIQERLIIIAITGLYVR